MTIILESRRIKFCIWEHNMEEYALKLWRNRKVSRYITATGEFNTEEINTRLRTEIENFERYGVQYFPIFLKNEDIFVGCCGLRPYTKERNTLEMGIHILPEFWKKGIGEEVCRAIIDYAFKNSLADRIFAGHNPNNIASEKLLKKLGFKFIGKEFYPPTGLMHPSYMKEKI